MTAPTSQYSLDDWQKRIQQLRKTAMPRPRDVVAKWADRVTNEGREFDSVDAFIQAARTELWIDYLAVEEEFNRNAMRALLGEAKFASDWLDSLASDFARDIRTSETGATRSSLEVRTNQLLGELVPYVYVLDLSTTQSRRSRAGKEFEAIIAYLLGSHQIPYSDQAAIAAAKSHTAAKPGKIVDFLVPSLEAYVSSRPNCAVLSCKTTLRERWQQVVEEKNRTNTDQLYLLTLDERIAPDKLVLCAENNIKLVVPAAVKAHIPSSAVIDFDRLFSHELPHKLSYWND